MDTNRTSAGGAARDRGCSGHGGEVAGISIVLHRCSSVFIGGRLLFLGSSKEKRSSRFFPRSPRRVRKNCFTRRRGRGEKQRDAEAPGGRRIPSVVSPELRLLSTTDHTEHMEIATEAMGMASGGPQGNPPVCWVRSELRHDPALVRVFRGSSFLGIRNHVGHLLDWGGVGVVARGGGCSGDRQNLARNLSLLISARLSIPSDMLAAGAAL
jgi:hypothetical protein